MERLQKSIDSQAAALSENFWGKNSKMPWLPSGYVKIAIENGNL
jgi:hypothetical protein